MHVYWATLKLLHGAFPALQASSRPAPACGQPVWIHGRTGLGPIRLPNYPRPPPCDADPWTSPLASRSGMLAPRTPHYSTSLMTPPSIIMAGVAWSVHSTGASVEAITILGSSSQAHQSHRVIGAWSDKERNGHVNVAHAYAVGRWAFWAVARPFPPTGAFPRYPGGARVARKTECTRASSCRAPHLRTWWW